MSFDITPLLLHSDDVPPAAKTALAAAESAPLPARALLKASAARVLWAETGLDCSEARELVGLPPGTCS